MKTYIVNTKDFQIHRDPTTSLCNVDEALPHYYRCGGFRAWWLLTFRGYDGCGHCLPKKSKNNGSRGIALA